MAPVLDALDVLDAMSAHYHEHYDGLLQTPWRLFCARWARMLDQVEEQRRERAAREAEREREAEMRRLRQAHEERLGERY